MKIEVCVELETMDLLLLFQIARNKNMDIESLIRQAIIEKVQREAQQAGAGEKK